MIGNIDAELRSELAEIETAGLFKRERDITTPQSRAVGGPTGDVLNFCANNYLGLADDPRIIAVAREALREWGFGMASVRFICGTQTQHVELEAALSAFLGTQATILFPSCFDANAGIFDALFGAADAIVSDELNHASLIDGIRLCKASRYRYRNRDLADLERQLRAASAARRKVIVTDGVFSMDGYLAPLPGICELAEKYGALVMVDDSHAVGFMGPAGRGTPDHFGVAERVDIVTGTLGKALGGGSGGYVSATAEIVEMLRQRARPYLFSNSIPPVMVAGAREALRLVAGAADARQAVHRNAARFRGGMAAAGFDLLPGEHPIVPVLFPDARTAGAMAEDMLARGVYVIAFSYPVVPKDSPRIRVQLSAAHTDDDIDRCVSAFTEARDAIAAHGNQPQS